MLFSTYCTQNGQNSFLSAIGLNYVFTRYGFDISGLDRRRRVRTEDNGIKTGRDIFRSRFDWQGNIQPRAQLVKTNDIIS